ncbi:MAG: class I SAM-dependent methyltransferase, partial [Eubacteriales bacterium]
MSSIWSDYVQKAGTLYLSRRLRFHDTFREKFTEAFSIPADEKLRILEVGCGPGALSQSLHRWYPMAEVTGLDFDENFISFAKKESPELDFIAGDATAMPFSSESFDVTISNTVSEHIEPEKFYREQ